VELTVAHRVVESDQRAPRSDPPGRGDRRPTKSAATAAETGSTRPLGRFYEVILLDLGTGITAPIATFAVEQADQVVVVTTPEWITNTKVQMALGHLRLDRATLVLNKVDGTAAQKATERQFSRDRIAQRVAAPTDLQLKTMLDSAARIRRAAPAASRRW
jgi:MinD-like ATPase involved in chromosome partitioning or flagellar assembly